MAFFFTDEDASVFVDNLFKALVKMLVNSKVTAYGRDSAMELITKNIVSKDGLDRTKPFLDTEGVENLLTVAGTQREFKTLQITSQSSMHASLALSKIYDDLINDKLREKFKEKCHEHFRDLFSDGIFESKIEAVAALSTLLQGPYEVGGMLLGLEGVTELMFTLANSDNVQYQKVGVEAIVSSASKKEKCSGILKDAVPILKKLYQSSEDHIKVRALVGLCKLGSFMGTDASSQPLAEGSNEKLAKICRKFLVNPTKDVDLRKWATEGLAYLTLDAGIKEELVNDTAALKSIFELAKTTERNTTYACVTVLVNLTNSYDKQDIMPELKELAKFAKQHVPEEHAKDKPEFVSGRIHKLAQAGVINALVTLADTDSKNSREQISRVFMSMSTEESLRGLIVQQGGIKTLLSLMNNNTDTGVILASHALAKVSVTSDPHFAFPGQRIYEVVRPLLSLLHSDRTGLQNFEALMALTNLSSVSDSVRNRILTEKGLASIEHYMFEDHEMLRTAATECMCNMVMSEKVQDMYEGENDRVKMMVLFAGEENSSLVKAATGALAILSARPSLCKKIVQVKAWLEIFQVHAISEVPEIQHRVCHCLLNIMSADKELASLIVQSPMLEILMAVAKQKDPKAEKATQAAQEALQKAVKYGLIKENEKGNIPDQFLEILRVQLAKARQEEEEKRKKEEEDEEKRRKLEEEEKKKALEKMEKEEEEEITVEKNPDESGPKIRELTEEEVAQLEEEEKAKLKKLHEEEKATHLKKPQEEETTAENNTDEESGPKIIELTDEEAARLEAEQKAKEESRKKNRMRQVRMK
ncbi:Protein unc-45 B [Bulinus truncatus]|nr:Protein unc-45 B [Bulinus truncatus]